MELNGKKIILGSGSPRRRELLSGLGLDFEVDTRNSFKEAYGEDIPHDRIPTLMARGKSHGFHRGLAENEILITSDTMVLCGEEVFGKPHSREDAVSMLKRLSGRSHDVVTAVTIRSAKDEMTFSDTAHVKFCHLTDEETAYYVDRFRPFDKAGAYAIQEWIGYIGIESIEGSFYTVMGLPTHLVYRHLKDFLKE